MSPKLSSDLERAVSDFKLVNVSKPSVQAKEATELNSNSAGAKSYNHVSRGLKSRHVQFIGLGGSIGTGLFLGVARALTAGGPLSMLLAFTLTGVAVFGMMQCLGEMATWLPLPGAIPIFSTRYVDGALGFAIGWMGWYTYSIAICTEISAGAIVIQYWDRSTNIAVWITIIIVVIIFLNIFAVSIYGEAEFWFASLKIVTILGLLILALILDLGGGPTHDRIGFRYWKNPGAMNTFIAKGDLGRFSGFFFCLILAAHTYSGMESVVIAAGETQDPRRNLPRAIRRVFWRIMFFYILGTLAIGVLVPFNSKALLTAQATSAPGAASSPSVIAIKSAGIPALPSIINAVILSSATSSANSYLYSGSRYLMSLAQAGIAPKLFMRCSKRGIPYYSVALTATLACLTYLSCSSGPSEVFIWLSNFVSLMALISWTVICTTYLRFYAALNKQGINRDDLPFKSPFQPYLAWGCIVYFSVLMIFSGFYAFTPWNSITFVSIYISIPLFSAFYLFWKLFKRTKFVDPSEADLWTGKAAIDAEVWPAPVPRNFLEKVWMWIV